MKDNELVVLEGNGISIEEAEVTNLEPLPEGFENTDDIVTLEFMTNEEKGFDEMRKYKEHFAKVFDVDPKYVEIVSLFYDDKGFVEVEYINHWEVQGVKIPCL